MGAIHDKFASRFFPINSKRRLFGVMLLTAIREPRRFFALFTPTNIKNLFYYLRAVGPYVIEQSLQRTIAGEEEGHLSLNNYLERLLTACPVEDHKATTRRESVDIIIPVFNGLPLLKVCLSSVLANSDNCRIIIVDDASTDTALPEFLATVSGGQGRNVAVHVLSNQENLGFVRSVNRALAEVSGHAVVLNSDTEVPPGWLDRLLAPILADESVATVTPLTNAGTICSFPEINVDNPIFKGLDVAEIDSFFSRYAPSEPIETPTGVGFCMAISHNSLGRLGLFDAESFGRGYCEESDFCRRAVKAGMHNVIAPNLFVFHNHGGTFTSTEKQRLLTVNTELLMARHPEYLASVDDFCRRDSLRDIRDLLSVLIDAQCRQRGSNVAIVDHALGGGANMYSKTLAEQLAMAGCGVLHLQASPLNNTLTVTYAGETVRRTMSLPLERANSLTSLIELFAVQTVVINEMVGWPDPLTTMAIVSGAGMPYTVLCHDFFPICPKWFLVGRNSEFCGIPEDMDTCHECLAGEAPTAFRALYGQAGFDRSEWCRSAGEFLAGAAGIVCFSEDSAAHFRRAYPGIKCLRVVEHAIPGRERFVWKQRDLSGGTLNVAVVGTIDQFKGIGILRDLLESKAFETIPVTLTIIGETTHYPPNHHSADGRFRVVGPYRRDELPVLLERYGTHVVLLPSIWPETFSYVTSEALLLGYPVICFDLGAQAERVRKYSCGMIVEERSATGLLTVLREILARPGQIADLSRQTRNYVPATVEWHFGEILQLLGIRDNVKQRTHQ